MKILTIIARVLLGLGFLVFGSNAFVHFLPMPELPHNLAGDYTRVFLASGYVYVIGGLQVIGGFLLLIGRFVPLALTILGGILVNILIFHALMAPEGFPPGLVFTALEIFLVWRIAKRSSRSSGLKILGITCSDFQREAKLKLAGTP